MQKDIKKWDELNLKIVGISYDSVEILKTFADAQKITFPLLSDPKSETILAYALKNKEMIGKSFGKVDLDGVPYPGTVIIDSNGKIVAKLFVDGYRERHSNDELEEAVKKLKK